jgi:putative zinc finger/helix-turn-helix YgiT family protein
MTNTTATKHNCEKQAKEHFATIQKPYRFLDSGLKNVYLVGVKYWVCPDCGSQAAEIPAPEQLMNVIAESIAMKQSLLSGAEIKFLRKRVGKKASDFAQLINKTPEHFSKLETEALELQPATDKLIRLVYAMLSGDEKLPTAIRARAEEWLKSIEAKKEERKIQIKKQQDTWVPLAA